MGFSRQGYWGGLPFPSPGDLPNPGIEPWVSCSASWFFTDWATSWEVPTWGYADILKCVYKTLSCFVWLEYQSGLFPLKVSKIPTKFGLSKKNFFYSCKWRFHNIGRAVSRGSGGVAFLGASFNLRQAFPHHSLMALFSDSLHFTSSIRDVIPFTEALAGPTRVEYSVLNHSGQSLGYSYTQNAHTQEGWDGKQEIKRFWKGNSCCHYSKHKWILCRQSDNLHHSPCVKKQQRNWLITSVRLWCFIFFKGNCGFVRILNLESKGQILASVFV